MPTQIRNLIVLGDSLSDIGIKREAPTGIFARATGRMRTNEVGRFSDGANWTDFLVEWAGSDSLIRDNQRNTESATAPHRSLNRDSLLIGTDTATLGPLRYANYAEGGAIAASDWKPMAGALGYIKDQVTEYIAARKALQHAGQYDGPTLHIIWIGLNDIVTAGRPDTPDLNPVSRTGGAAKQPRTDVFRQPVSSDGTGITPLVQEIREQVNRIANEFATSRDDEHFLLIDLPDPSVSVRYQDKIADKGDQAVADLSRRIARFNELMGILTAHWPGQEYTKPGDPPPAELGAVGANITLVRMSEWMAYVSAHPDVFELTPLAQQQGPVRYLGAPDTLPPKLRRAVTTSDLAHPTAAVYELIARKIADTLLTGYTLGKLNQQRWPAVRPFPNVP